MRFYASTIRIMLLSPLTVISIFAQWASDPAINIPICEAEYNQLEPFAVTDTEGGAIVVWSDQLLSGEFNIYAQRIDRDGYIQWPARGVPICIADRDQVVSDIVSDSSGGAFIVWNDYRYSTNPQGNYHENVKCFIQHINAYGQILWEENGLNLFDVDSSNFYLANLVSDGVGGAIVAFLEDLAGENSSLIHLQRFNNSGEYLWDSITTISDTTNPGSEDWYVVANDDQGLYLHKENSLYLINSYGDLEWSTQLDDFYAMVSDGFGGVICARNEPYWNGTEVVSRILGKRIDDNGSHVWGEEWLLVASEASSFVSNPVNRDGGGGGVFTWLHTAENESQIFCQRITSEGELGWNQNSLISSSNDFQYNIQSLMTSNEEIVYVWINVGSENGDDFTINGQRINLNGTSLWGELGVIITERDNSLRDPLVVEGDNLGTICVWSSLSIASGWDIYGQYLNNDGDLTPTSIKIKGSPKTKYTDSFFSLYPNPTNNSVIIDYYLEHSSYVKISIYNTFGNLIAELLAEE